MELKLESYKFNANTIFNVAKNVSLTFFGFKITYDDPGNIYHVKVYPVINGTRQDLLIDEFNLVNGYNTKAYTKSYLNTKLNQFIGNNAYSFDFLLKFIKQSNNAIDYIETAFNMTLDNADFSYNTDYPTLTSDSSYVYKETTATNNKYLFPNNVGQPNYIDLKLTVNLDHDLNTVSYNNYGHTYYMESPFKDSNNNLIFKNYGGAKYFVQPSSGYSTTTYLINPMKYIKDNKINIKNEELIGTYFKPTDYNLTTKLIGSYGTNGKEKSIITQNMKSYFIYAWQHLYDFKDSRIYWDNCPLNYWQTNGSQNLNIYLKADPDDNFKVDNTYNWNELPWPKIQYKIKMFSQEVSTFISDFKMYRTNGYSLTTTDQYYIKYLWDTDIETMPQFAHKEEFAPASGYRQLDTTVTIPVSGADFNNFRDNTEFHIYLITKDSLGFYQAIYFNEAINKDGYVLNSPDRTI